jgi:glycine hydroxymethyltransferase
MLFYDMYITVDFFCAHHHAAGTPAMTTRGCLESDFEIMAEFLLRAAHIASIVLKEHGRLQKDFLKGLENNNDIIELRNQVETFALQFAMPGFDV